MTPPAKPAPQRPLTTITLELLRHGPWHNHLLSPLIKYLALCEDSAPESVAFPLEHHVLLKRLRSLQYAARDHERDDLESIGDAVAQMIGSVTTLTEELNKDDKFFEVHVVTSAAEVALIPFELYRVRSGHDSRYQFTRDDSPMIVTRSVRRRVWRTGFHWPSSPRVLVVAGRVERSLLDRQVSAIRAALRDRPDAVTVLEHASLDTLKDACCNGMYPYVHVLAHGRLLDGDFPHIGLELYFDSSDQTHAVGADDLLNALRSGDDDTHLPSLVMLATCNSASESSVLTPGGSLAYELHKGGVPFVVASQFPLTQEGSVWLTKKFYAKHLDEGVDPRRAIYSARTALQRECRNTHDWASLVVYSRLPPGREITRDPRLHQVMELLSREHDKSPADLISRVFAILKPPTEWPNRKELLDTSESAFKFGRIYAIDHFAPSIWAAGEAYYWLALQAREFAKANYDSKGRSWLLHFTPRVYHSIKRAIRHAATVLPLRGRDGVSYTSFDNADMNVTWTPTREANTTGLELSRILIWPTKALQQPEADFVIDFHDTFRIPLFFLRLESGVPSGCNLTWEYLFGCSNDATEEAEIDLLGGAPWDLKAPLPGYWKNFIEYHPLRHFNQLLEAPQLLLASDALRIVRGNKWDEYLDKIKNDDRSVT